MVLPGDSPAPLARALALILLLSASPVRAADPADTFARLAAAYRPQPQGYPTGREFARPDPSVPFR